MIRTLTLSCLWPLAVLAASTVVNAQDAPGQAKPPEKKAPQKPTEDSTFVNPQTARLAKYIGTWRITEKHFSSNGQTIATRSGTEEVTWILNRRAIQRTYTTATSTEGSSFQAIGILAWNAAIKKYDGVWFNDTSTLGPTIVKGDWPDSSDTMNMQLEALAPGGASIELKAVEQHVDDDHRINTTYTIDGDQVVKRLEVVYQRVAPCPDKLRLIGG